MRHRATEDKGLWSTDPLREKKNIQIAERNEDYGIHMLGSAEAPGRPKTRFAEINCRRLTEGPAGRTVVAIPQRGYPGIMKTYVDIRGASGAFYRFKNVATLSKLPATAGNFALISDVADTDLVACCGTALSLSRAPFERISRDHWNLPVFVPGTKVECIE